jgi:hypothetical protein
MKTKTFITMAICAGMLTSTAYARSFNNDSPAQQNLTSANKQTVCFLYKTSVKGSKGFFGGDNKSVEGSCQDAGGNIFNFSASGSFYKDLTMFAAQEVIIITGANKGANKLDGAKTKNVVMSIKPLQENDLEENVICGAEDLSNIEYGVKASKIYSVGYRVSRPVSFDKKSKEWHMSSYVGIVEDEPWSVAKGKYSGVTLTASCLSKMSLILKTKAALIFDYMQTKEGGKYTIGRVAVVE